MVRVTLELYLLYLTLITWHFQQLRIVLEDWTVNGVLI